MKGGKEELSRKRHFLTVDLLGIRLNMPIIPRFLDTRRMFLRGNYTSVKVGRKRKYSAVFTRYIKYIKDNNR